MIYRAEPLTLLIFNPNTSLTAAISGKELLSLKNHLKEGYRDEFICRLYDMKLVPENLEEERKNIIDKIEETSISTAPLRAFKAPESIHIDLITSCPLNCPQCYKDIYNNHQMDFDKFASIIDQARKMGVFQIAIGGGEPLLVKNLDQYVKYVRSSEMACTITTSGWGLTLDILKSLQEAGVNHIQISLNGSRKDIHSYSRDGFDEGIMALKLLSENSIRFGINWVARMDNVYDFDNMIILAQKLKADNINILRYKPTPREDYRKVVLTEAAIVHLKDTIKNTRGIKLKIDSAFSNLLCNIHSERTSPLTCGCGAGRRFMVIDAYGRLKPCSHLKVVSDEKDILSYWQSSEELNILRQGEEFIRGICSECRYINVCRGCRAICEKLYGDINAGEQNCISFLKKEMI